MENHKKGALILVSISVLFLFALAYFANLVLPEFKEVFDGFDTDLPFSTSLVMSSYPVWWLLPILASILVVDLFRRKTDINSRYITRVKQIGIAGIAISIFLFIFSVYAVYSPVINS